MVTKPPQPSGTQKCDLSVLIDPCLTGLSTGLMTGELLADVTVGVLDPSLPCPPALLCSLEEFIDVEDIAVGEED